MRNGYNQKNYLRQPIWSKTNLIYRLANQLHFLSAMTAKNFQLNNIWILPTAVHWDDFANRLDLPKEPSHLVHLWGWLYPNRNHRRALRVNKFKDSIKSRITFVDVNHILRRACTENFKISLKRVGEKSEVPVEGDQTVDVGDGEGRRGDVHLIYCEGNRVIRKFVWIMADKKAPFSHLATGGPTNVPNDPDTDQTFGLNNDYRKLNASTSTSRFIGVDFDLEVNANQIHLHAYIHIQVCIIFMTRRCAGFLTDIRLDSTFYKQIF